MSIFLRFFLILSISAAHIGMAGAPKAGAQTPIRVQTEKTPPYEDRLLRLSEIIGSLHFLTLLCKPEDGLLWYNKMQEILTAEAPSQLRRAKLVERFNSGFSGFQATYRKCTPSAETALERYIAEAQAIVQTLTSDFSG